MLPDLRPVILDRSAVPVVQAQLRHRDLHLLRDELHDLIRQLDPPAWEATMTVVEPQQQRKGKARRATLARDPVVLVIRQSPALNQLVELDRPICGWPYFRPRL